MHFVFPYRIACYTDRIISVLSSDRGFWDVNWPTEHLTFHMLKPEYSREPDQNYECLSLGDMAHGIEYAILMNPRLPNEKNLRYLCHLCVQIW